MAGRTHGRYRRRNEETLMIATVVTRRRAMRDVGEVASLSATLRPFRSVVMEAEGCPNGERV